MPDSITEDFINRRKNPKHKKDAVYYRPDTDAQYAESYVIDLDRVEPLVARYPSPDDVVPVSDVAGTALDGCFIGACTTAQEDLILAALVLEAGLKQGLKPAARGKRKVVPGSRPILHDLEERGLADIYREAGFEIGVPGCSYCVGMSADKAGKGEVWLSSQNRNFKNRMGPGKSQTCCYDFFGVWLSVKGAIGSITSAITVAASSFGMAITDPTALLEEIDQERLHALLDGSLGDLTTAPRYVEPASVHTTIKVEASPSRGNISSSNTLSDHEVHPDNTLVGKAQTLGDFIDTDALAPSESLVGGLSPEEMGTFCLYHTHPDFRRKVKDDGLTIVVAGKAFGVGSSRENAVTALQGAGVKCVIAQSFAFIYARNQANLGLLGIVMNNEEFYKLAKDGVPIYIDVEKRLISICGKEFPFELTQLELQLWQRGGMSSAFAKWGKGLFEVMTGRGRISNNSAMGKMEKRSRDDELDW